MFIWFLASSDEQKSFAGFKTLRRRECLKSILTKASSRLSERLSFFKYKAFEVYGATSRKFFKSLAAFSAVDVSVSVGEFAGAAAAIGLPSA